MNNVDSVVPGINRAFYMRKHKMHSSVQASQCITQTHVEGVAAGREAVALRAKIRSKPSKRGAMLMHSYNYYRCIHLDRGCMFWVLQIISASVSCS